MAFMPIPQTCAGTVLCPATGRTFLSLKSTWKLVYLLKYMLTENIRWSPQSNVILRQIVTKQMWIRRDGSVQGPLWPREIRDIVTNKFMKVFISIYYPHIKIDTLSCSLTHCHNGHFRSWLILPRIVAINLWLLSQLPPLSHSTTREWPEWPFIRSSVFFINIIPTFWFYLLGKLLGVLQWNLRIMDKLVHRLLSTIQRLSFIGGF